eukprot:TRINITY_DN3261_c0_g3_i2.p1 TRINITY_DN3261_c0_g3~~TRINITY_DN3261_c0_g3_i2.p1  ORF type:complete len:459 (-),score=47.93 TRINITY_DN3261_c0_g3_i2:636-1835(-)
MRVDGKEWDAVRRLYGTLWGAVRMEGWTSDFVELRAGIKQGGVISPFLFAIYINDLIEGLVKKGLGTYEYCVELAVLLFADDVALIAGSFEEAQKLTNEVVAWAKRWGMAVAGKKCMVIASKYLTGEVRIEGTVLERVKSTRYLGVIISEDLKWKDQEKWLLGRVKERVGALMKTGLVVREMGVVDGIRLWKALVHPLAYWAVGAWNPSKGWMAEMDRIKRKFVRRLMGVNPMTANAAVEGETGIWRAADDVVEKRVMFWFRIRESSNMIVRKRWERIEETDIGKTVWKDLKELDLHDGVVDKAEWKRKAKQGLARRAQARWKEEVKKVPKLEWYSKIKKTMGMEEYLDGMGMGGKVELARMRTSGGDLMIELGRRWPKLPRENRLCPVCEKEVEDRYT